MFYKSMASSFSEIVDCRALQLELEFLSVTKKQLSKIAELCVVGIKKIIGNHIWGEYRFNNKRINEIQLLKQISDYPNSFNYTYEADIISSLVFNQKSFTSYSTLLNSSFYSRSMQMCSDYSRLYNNYIHQDLTGDDWKNAILKIFYEKNKKKLSYWNAHDISCFFSCCRHSGQDKLFFGRFHFSIALDCIKLYVDEFSNLLKLFAIEISQEAANISGRITLSPIKLPEPCSGHMRYFGTNVAEDGSHNMYGYIASEWYPYYYLQGAEWFNIISPLQQLHLPKLIEQADNYSDVKVLQVQDKFVVKLDKSIANLNADDLIPIKQLLYNALYPGQFITNFNDILNLKYKAYPAKPRFDLEVIPIFENEIDILESGILFIHSSTGDGSVC